MEILGDNSELADLVEQINRAEWDEENDIEDYSVAALKSYLEKQDTVFIVCFLSDDTGTTLAGMASGRIEQKPYDHFKWLYIDEVDTCSNHRQRGVGTALMRKLLEFASDNDCEEVWLGAETRNTVANEFYKSLQADAVDAVVGYTFEL